MLRALLLLVLAVGPLAADEKSVDDLVATIKTRATSQAKLEAVKALAKEGPKNKAAVQGLALACADRLTTVSGPASEALKEMGEPVVPVLIECLKSSDKVLMQGAVVALGAIGPKAKEAIPALLQAHKENQMSALLRSKCNDALVKIGPDVVKPLIERLQDDTAQIRQDAAVVLGRLGEKAKDAAPALKKALEMEKNALAKSQLQHALDIVGGDTDELRERIADLFRQMSSRDVNVAIKAERELARLGPLAVAILAHGLKNRDSAIQYRCLRVLGQMHKGEAKEAATALIAFIEKENGSAKGEAAHVLGQIGPVNDKVVPALRSLLKTKSPYGQAARALGEIGPAAKDAIPDLIDLVKTQKSGSVAVDCIHALAMIGEAAVPEVVKLLESKEADHRTVALDVFKQMGSRGAEAAGALLGALKDAEEESRNTIAGILKRLGPDAVAVVAKGLKDEELVVRKHTAGTLSELGPGAVEAVEPLVAALKDEHAIIRAECAKALGRIGPGASKAIPALLDVLKDEDRLTAREAGEALFSIGRIAAILQGLKHKEAVVRTSTAETIDRGYPFDRRLQVEEIRALIDALIPALKDDDARMRKYAATGLGKIGQLPEVIVPAMKPLLQDKDQDVRLAVVTTIGNLYKRAPNVSDDLLKVAEDSKGELRAQALLAAARIGGPGEKIVPLLKEAWKEKSPTSRVLLVQAVGHLGTGVGDGATLLNEALKEKDSKLRGAAAAAVYALGPAAKEAVPALIELLKEKPAAGGIDLPLATVIGALERIGPDAKAAVPAFKELLKTPEGNLYFQYVLRAVRAIDPEAARTLRDK